MLALQGCFWKLVVLSGLLNSASVTTTMRRWFHNLKVSQKLMLISIFFVMPDSVMLYLFITGINANIQFARMEQKGNQYQRPLEELLELIPQDRQLAQRALQGQQAAVEQLSKKQAAIESTFDA